MKDIFAQNEKDLNINNIMKYILRCPNCNLIPSLKLNYKEGKPMINYECENNHKGNISLEEYMEVFNKYALTKHNCDECNKSKNEIKNDFLYCNKCSKFICNLCSEKHINDGDNHNLTILKRYDALCKIHSNFFSFYCVICKMNICAYCTAKHELHDFIHLSRFLCTDEYKNKLDEEIKKM